MNCLPQNLGYATPKMQTEPGWYCARTKPKHEHIAVANLRKNLGLKVFHPRLRLERNTSRGIVRVNEPLFPCYIFVHCKIAESLSDIQYTVGIRSMVHFNHQMPTIPDSVIYELQSCFEGEEPMIVESCFVPGTKVLLGEGAFAGMSALVLRVIPSRQRVQVLLEVLGRLAPVEVDRASITLEDQGLMNLVPRLAVSDRELLRT
jgi:transcriptional antiterminator RfaH